MTIFRHPPYPADPEHGLHRRLTASQLVPGTEVPRIDAFMPRTARREATVSVEDGRRTTPEETAARGANSPRPITHVVSVTTMEVYEGARRSGADGRIVPRPAPTRPNPAHAELDVEAASPPEQQAFAQVCCERARVCWRRRSQT